MKIAIAGTGYVGLSNAMLLAQLYAPFTHNHEHTRVMDIKSAEFTKYATARLPVDLSLAGSLKIYSHCTA